MSQEQASFSFVGESGLLLQYMYMYLQGWPDFPHAVPEVDLTNATEVTCYRMIIIQRPTHLMMMLQYASFF